MYLTVSTGKLAKKVSDSSIKQKKARASQKPSVDFPGTIHSDDTDDFAGILP